MKLTGGFRRQRGAGARRDTVFKSSLLVSPERGRSPLITLTAAAARRLASHAQRLFHDLETNETPETL